MVRLVAEHLEKYGVDYQLYVEDDAEAVPGEAPHAGTDAEERIRSVVLDIRTGHALAVVPASATVDVERVKEALNTRHVSLATREEVERDYPEYEPEGLPPIASLVHTPLVVDPHVLEQEMVVFPAGSPRHLIRARAADVFRDSNLIVAAIATSAEETAEVAG